MNNSHPTSPVQQFLRRFKDLFTRILGRLCPGKKKVLSPTSMPFPFPPKALSAGDWSKRDTMVGTVRNKEQLAYNLSLRCYYVPGKFLPKEQLPIKYIVLHEWDEEDIPCILRIGEVLNTDTIPRGSIPVTMRPGSDPAEPYHYFTVKQWSNLPHRIEIRDTPRGKPLFTHSFLLDHCYNSYALFAVETQEDFRLLQAMEQLLEAEHPSGKQGTPIFSTPDGSCLTVRGPVLTLTGKHGDLLAEIPVSRCKESPRSAFLSLKRLISN